MDPRPGRRERLKTWVALRSRGPSASRGAVGQTDKVSSSADASFTSHSHEELVCSEVAITNVDAVRVVGASSDAPSTHPGIPDVPVAKKKLKVFHDGVADNTPGMARSFGPDFAGVAVRYTSCPGWNKGLELLKDEEPAVYGAMEAITPTQHDLTALFTSMEAKFENSKDKKKSAASSQWFARLKRTLPSIAAVKGVSMAAARAEPHQLAPYICAGVFCIIELALNFVNPEDALLIAEIVSENSMILKKWIWYETHITTHGNPSTLLESEGLSRQLPELYKGTLSLLFAVSLHMDSSRWQKAKATLSQLAIKWKVMFEDVKQMNKKCDGIKARIEVQVNARKDYEAVLNWISARSLEESHSQVMEKTGIINKYSERGAWLFGSKKFEDWQSGIGVDPQNRVFWLKGSVGTGKTTLICRAIEAFSYDQSVGPDRPLRLCHFYCSTGTGAAPPDCETIIRGLLRQMAVLPDFTVAGEAIARYNQHEQSQSQKSALSLTEWQALFFDVTRSDKYDIPSVIFIDALDECETRDTNDLLQFLAIAVEKCPNLYLMVSSQLHVKVSTFFAVSMLRSILTASTNTKEDVEFYVSKELETRAALPTNREYSVLSSDLGADLKERFRKALISGANGMFQWVKIWLAIIFPSEPIVHMKEAEALLKALESQGSLDTTDEDQWKSLNSAYTRLYTTVRHRPADRLYKVRAYRVILGALEPLTMATIAEAASVEDDGTVTASVTEKYIRELCHNFYVEDADQKTRIAHESTKLFLQSMLNHGGHDGSLLDDYSPEVNNREIVRVCLQVAKQPQHPMWKRWDLDPRDWLSRFGNEARPGPWRNIAHRMFIEDAEERLQVPAIYSDHFGSYVLCYFLSHWESLTISINRGFDEADQPYLESLTILLQEVSSSALAGCMLLLNAYIVRSADIPGQYGARFTRSSNFPVRRFAYRVSDCIVKCEDKNLAVDGLLLACAFQLIPQTCIIKYIDHLASGRNISGNDLGSLLASIDAVTENLAVSNKYQKGLLHLAAKGEGDIGMIEALLKIERLRNQNKVPGLQTWESSLLLARDSLGDTPLHCACGLRDTNSGVLVKTILAAEAGQTGCQFSHERQKPRNSSGWLSRLGCQVNKRSETPLLIAVKCGNGEAVSLLIAAGAAETLADDINGVPGFATVLNSRDVLGFTPLAHAVKGYDSSIQVLEMLLRVPDVNINLQDNRGLTPLAHAVRGYDSSIQALETLLRVPDVDINLQDNRGLTPLAYAVRGHSHSVQALETLLRVPDVDINLQDNRGLTPLAHAVKDLRDPSVQALEMLLRVPDLDINLQDNRGLTPLAHAVRGYDSSIQALETLLRVPDVDINLQDNRGLTPLAHVLRGYNPSVQALEALLRVPGLDINLPDNNGEAPLHHLVANASRHLDLLFQLATILLGDSRTKADVMNKDSQTPLWKAAQKGRASLVRTLCGRPDVNLDRLDKWGRSPLWIAVAYERADIIELLRATPRLNLNPVDNQNRALYRDAIERWSDTTDSDDSGETLEVL